MKDEAGLGVAFWKFLLAARPCRGDSNCLQVTDDGFGDALDDQLGDRVQPGIAGVFRFQEGWLVALLDKSLQGGLPVDEGGDDIVVIGEPGFEDNDIALVDTGLDHAVSADFQGEGASGLMDFSGGLIHLDAGNFAGGLDAIGITGGNLAEEFHIDLDDVHGTFGALVVVLVGNPEGAGLAGDAADVALFLQRSQVAHHGIGALKVEMALDLADAGPVAVITEVNLDKPEDFLLAEGEVFHGLEKKKILLLRCIGDRVFTVNLL